MAKKETKFDPPFAWAKDYAAPIGLWSSVLIAAIFRFSALSSLPPGIDNASARIGLQALNLLNHHWLPGLTSANGYAPIFVWIQALFIGLLGHTATALRVGPALLGTLAVVTTWYWVKNWFGLRAAWISSFLLAITPWAVTISRNGTAASLLPLIVSLTLLITARVWRHRTWINGLLLAAVVALDLVSGPVGWLIAGVILLAGLWYLFQEHSLLVVDSARVGAAAGLLVALAVFGYAAGLSVSQLKILPHATGAVTSFSQLLSNLGATLLMFNVSGDMNYRHNLAGMPMLNAFVGLMFVAGLIVAVSKVHERKYRFVILMFFAMLIPAVITSVGVPDAARAAGSMPLVFLLAAIGISYMLDMWYRTFPINSAARTSGQFAILILLALSLFQGYTQYFRAWAATDQVYPAYDEGAVQLALQMAHSNAVSSRRPFRYVVATTDEDAVVQYLDGGDLYYKALTPAQILTLPDTKGDFQFWVTPSEKDAAVTSLKPKLPGGVLRPHYSNFNQAEIYYTYEVTK
jgi:Dolichyl-phosphate-mannose-protein mannosyltransferase